LWKTEHVSGTVTTACRVQPVEEVKAMVVVVVEEEDEEE
jgi:hypothetical protein